MTRTEFDRYFSLSMDDDAAVGYTAAQVAALNDQVFAAVSETDVDGDDVRQIVANAWDAAHNGFGG